MAGGVFPKGFARKNRICELNHVASLYFDFSPLLWTVRQLYTTAGGVFPKGLVRKNRICDLNRGDDESDVEKKFRRCGHAGRALTTPAFIYSIVVPNHEVSQWS
jgi:hypothetical protein